MRTERLFHAVTGLKNHRAIPTEGNAYHSLNPALNNASNRSSKPKLIANIRNVVVFFHSIQSF